jgi:hypothetical protein
MNPYHGAPKNLLPREVGRYKQDGQITLFEQGKAPPGFKNSPELKNDFVGGATVSYTAGNDLVGLSVFNFSSAEKAKDNLQLMKGNYVKRGFNIKEEVSKQSGSSTAGERVLLVYESDGGLGSSLPETELLWSNGSVIFLVGSPSKKHFEDVLEFEKNFRY